MAARITRVTNNEEIRSRIKVSLLLEVLEKQALSLNDKKGEPIPELSPTRMKAIEILLRKALPDLTSITLEGNAEKPIRLITRAD